LYQFISIDTTLVTDDRKRHSIKLPRYLLLFMLKLIAFTHKTNINNTR